MEWINFGLGLFCLIIGIIVSNACPILGIIDIGIGIINISIWGYLFFK